MMKPISNQKTGMSFVFLFVYFLFFPTHTILSQINQLDEKNLEATMRNPWKPDTSMFFQDQAVGDIQFLLKDFNPEEKTITVYSASNLDQTILKQTAQMEVYTTGGKTVVKRMFNCSEPVILNYDSWTDGVYEFRFAYKDIRGKAFFKYASWYKGDILFRAREIVNSAPARDVMTPEAATHRMLADIILDRLGKNL